MVGQLGAADWRGEVVTGTPGVCLRSRDFSSHDHCFPESERQDGGVRDLRMGSLK